MIPERRRLFARRLIEVMRKQDDSIQSLAKALGCPAEIVYQYVEGETFPTLIDLARLSLRYKVSMEWLMGLTNNRKENE